MYIINVLKWVGFSAREGWYFLVVFYGVRVSKFKSVLVFSNFDSLILCIML